MPGPLPNPNARRRDRGGQRPGVLLPAAGRPGPPPAWPLASHPQYVERERELWAALWQRPQAVAWERYGLEYTAARYVQLLRRIEQPSATTAEYTEARRLEDALGLSPMALARLRWEIGEADDMADGPADDTADHPADERAAQELHIRRMVFDPTYEHYRGDRNVHERHR